MALSILQTNPQITDCETNNANWSDVAGTVTALGFLSGFNVAYYIAHPFKNGDPIRFTVTGGGVLPTGLALNTTYYVINAVADTFAFSLTVGGAGVGISDNGTATINVVLWATSSFNTDIFLQGTACRAIYASAATAAQVWYDFGSNLDLRNNGSFVSRVGMWLWVTQPNLLETLANNGLAILIGTSKTAYNIYKVHGSDTYPARGGWFRVWVTVTDFDSQVGGGLTPLTSKFFGIQYTIGKVVGSNQNIAIDQIHYIKASTPAHVLTMWGGSSGTPENMESIAVADGASTRGAGTKYGTVVNSGGAYLVNSALRLGGPSNAAFLRVNNKAIIFQNQPAADLPNLLFNLEDAGSGYVFTGCQFGAVVNGQGQFATQGSVSNAEFNTCLVQNLAAILCQSTTTAYVDTTFDGTTMIITSGSVNGGVFINSGGSISLAWGFLGAFSMPDMLGLADDLSFTMGAVDSHAMGFDGGAPSGITLSGHSYTGYAVADGSVGDEVIYNQSGKEITFTLTNGTPVPSVRNVDLLGVPSTHIIINNRTLTITVVDVDGAVHANTFDITITDGAASPTQLAAVNYTANPLAKLEYAYPFADAGDTVTILVNALGYEALSVDYVLTTSDASVQLQVQADRTYL